MTGNDEKYQEMMKNAIFGCGKWCCNRHNRYRRNFLVQIGLVMGQVFRKCEIWGQEEKCVGRSNSDSDELVQ